MTKRKVASLLDLVRRLVDNSNLTLAESAALPDILSKAARSFGAQPGEIYIVEVQEKRGGAAHVSYDLGFNNSDPAARGQLITMAEALATDWVPPNAEPELASRATKKDDPEAGSSFSNSVFTE